VLLAVGGLGEDAYAIPILKLLQEEANRNADVTAIHSVLRRLEDKGFVKSIMGGATKERGGRRKKYFTLTNTGRETLDEIMEIRSAMYNKIPKLSFIGLRL
ncbi:MAG: PadR family transcriptional regulator, partial [Fulvivirga sp.]|uniref:PadR family transcriptional regulator n=1 Tax=Fulvivirga sp. TaxID=1931237 RepID=UPI0032EF62AC